MYFNKINIEATGTRVSNDFEIYFGSWFHKPLPFAKVYVTVFLFLVKLLSKYTIIWTRTEQSWCNAIILHCVE